MPNFKSKSNVLHLIEWIVSTVAAGALADATCFSCWKHYIKNQFIDASVFGYFIICCFLFVMIFTDEEFGEKVGHYIRGLGGSLYIISGILVLLYLDDDHWQTEEDHKFYRVLVGGVFAVINGILFSSEFFIVLFKKSLLE